MNRCLLAVIGMLIGVGCSAGPPRPAPGTAGLRVKVVAEPKAGVRPPPQAVSTYDATGTPNSYGPFARVDYAELDSIVVWLEPTAGQPASSSYPPPASPAEFTVDPSKSSHGIDGVVGVGQHLILRNAGAKAQSIYSVSDGNDFDRDAVPPGGTAEYVVRSPGLIEVFADSSKDTAVQIYAAPTRWAHVSRAGQTLDFVDLPPGRYTLASWHPRLPGTTQSIELVADRVADAVVKVGVNQLPKVTAADAAHR